MKKILVLTTLFSVCFGKYSDYMTKLIDQKEIDRKIRTVAKEISKEYEGKRLVVISVLKGAIFVSVDIMSHLDIPYEIEFVKCSSYRGAVNRGTLDIRFLNEIKVKDKHLLIIDDIYDSGKTMISLMSKIQEKEPASIKTLTLLHKKVSRDSMYVPDYVLFEIEDRFVIGYGLDFKEYYRGLKGIWVLHPPFPLPFEQ